MGKVYTWIGVKAIGNLTILAGQGVNLARGSIGII